MSIKDKLKPNDGDFVIEGGRVGILLAHGLGSTPVELRFLAQGLARNGYTVYCPLLRGHGGSDMLLNTTSWHDWLKSLETAFLKLREVCDVVIVGGQSAGGVLSVHLAAEHGDAIDGLMLFSPTFWPNGWAIPRHFQLFRLITQKWFANLFHLSERKPYGIKDDRIRRFVLDSLQSEGREMRDIIGRRGGTVLEFRWMTDRARRRLSEIRVPALVIHAREDDQSDLSNAFVALRRLAGRVELVVLDDSYHVVTLDRQRGEVLDRTLAYVARIESAVSAKRQDGAAAAGAITSGDMASGSSA